MEVVTQPANIASRRINALSKYSKIKKSMLAGNCDIFREAKINEQYLSAYGLELAENREVCERRVHRQRRLPGGRIPISKLREITVSSSSRKKQSPAMVALRRPLKV